MGKNKDQLLKLYEIAVDPHIGKDCCMACHFHYEDLHTKKYLPPNDYKELVLQHNRLKSLKEKLGYFPEDEIIKHSDWETPIFEKYLPKKILDHILAYHLKYNLDHHLPFYYDGLKLEES